MVKLNIRYALPISKHFYEKNYEDRDYDEEPLTKKCFVKIIAALLADLLIWTMIAAFIIFIVIPVVFVITIVVLIALFIISVLFLLSCIICLIGLIFASPWIIIFCPCFCCACILATLAGFITEATKD